MQDFLGKKYKLASSENFDEFMKALGKYKKIENLLDLLIFFFFFTLPYNVVNFAANHDFLMYGTYFFGRNI